MLNQIRNQGSSDGKLGPVVRYVALSVVFVVGILSIIASGTTEKKKKPISGLLTNEELRAEIYSLQQEIRRIEEGDRSYQEAIRQGYPVRSSSSEAVAHEARMAEIQRRRDRINDIKRELQKRGPEE
jgi:hypothetical protein